MEQIDENEQERLFELERKDQENIQMQRWADNSVVRLSRSYHHLALVPGIVGNRVPAHILSLLLSSAFLPRFAL